MKRTMKQATVQQMGGKGNLKRAPGKMANARRSNSKRTNAKRRQIAD